MAARRNPPGPAADPPTLTRRPLHRRCLDRRYVVYFTTLLHASRPEPIRRVRQKFYGSASASLAPPMKIANDEAAAHSGAPSRR
jgi:hypothetical protein